jgi:hypothetical protein
VEDVSRKVAGEVEEGFETGARAFLAMEEKDG